MKLSNILRVLFSLGLVVLLSQAAFAKIEFKPGAELRLRHEFWKNPFDQRNEAKDNRNYFRIKYSLTGDLLLDGKTNVFLKLTDEFKTYTYFYQSSGEKNYRFDINETVWDNFYLNIKDVLDAPVDIRLGRQDFLGTYGEGFLIMDGTPIDGSRTFYFNALKSSWKANDKNTVDFIYINNPRYDSFLPIINEQDTPSALNVTNEQGYVLDWQNKDIENLFLETYLINKKESGDHGSRLQAQKSNISAPGIFAKYQMSPFVFRGQFAYETGSYGESDRRAFGYYGFIDRAFKDAKFSPKVSVGYIYLSGDDPSTKDNEGWDPLFSRWPWMSELYCLNYNGESGMAYWTNLQMWRAELGLKFTEKMKGTLWYNYLLGNETPTGTSFAIDDGRTRGQLPQARLDYTFNKNWTGYILAEYFIPGNYYDTSADESLFVRAELRVKF